MNIRLSDEELAHLRRWDADGASVGAVVRRLIREELQREQQRVDRLAEMIGYPDPLKGPQWFAAMPPAEHEKKVTE